MKSIYYSIYGLIFLVLKPLITFIAYPETFQQVQNITAPRSEWYSETFTRPLGFHLEGYFEYHNEAFFFSLILTAILFLMLDRKNLLKK